jgi:WD40 repeat protein
MVLEGHEWGISSLVQLSSGLIASGSHDCKIRLWNLEAVHEHERCVQVLEGHRGVVSALEQLGNGLLASGSWDGSIRLWRLNSPAAGAAPSPSAECILVLEGHRRCVLCMCVLSDGITLMSGSDDNTVKLWNTRTGECINTLNGHTDYVHSVSALADNKTVASCANDGTVRFWQF